MATRIFYGPQALAVRRIGENVMKEIKRENIRKESREKDIYKDTVVQRVVLKKEEVLEDFGIKKENAGTECIVFEALSVKKRKRFEADDEARGMQKRKLYVIDDFVKPGSSMQPLAFMRSASSP